MTCYVCLEPLSGIVVHPNGCTHNLHWHCLNNWVSHRRLLLDPGQIITCPVCRQGDCNVVHFVDNRPPPEQQRLEQQPAGPVQGQYMPPTPNHLTCHICGRLFNNTAMKSYHVPTHNGRLECGGYNLTFAFQSGLRRHQRENNH